MWVKMADDNPALWRQSTACKNLVLSDSDEEDFTRFQSVPVIDAPDFAV